MSGGHFDYVQRRMFDVVTETLFTAFKENGSFIVGRSEGSNNMRAAILALARECER